MYEKVSIQKDSIISQLSIPFADFNPIKIVCGHIVKGYAILKTKASSAQWHLLTPLLFRVNLYKAGIEDFSHMQMSTV